MILVTTTLRTQSGAQYVFTTDDETGYTVLSRMAAHPLDGPGSGLPSLVEVDAMSQPMLGESWQFMTGGMRVTTTRVVSIVVSGSLLGD